jgi:hypothetical protein
MGWVSRLLHRSCQVLAAILAVSHVYIVRTLDKRRRSMPIHKFAPPVKHVLKLHVHPSSPAINKFTAAVSSQQWCQNMVERFAQRIVHNSSVTALCPPVMSVFRVFSGKLTGGLET